MATSVKHAVQGGILVIILGGLGGCWGSAIVDGASPLPGCPVDAPPTTATEVGACLAGLQFDTATAAGDEQRLLVQEMGGAGAACHGDSSFSCRHGPLAKIEPVLGAHKRTTEALDHGRIIARLFLRPGEIESYPKLGLVPGDMTYWWIQRQSDSSAISRYVTVSGVGGVDTTAADTIAIEVHPPNTFRQALARFLWAEDDEKTQGPCGMGCCRG